MIEAVREFLWMIIEWLGIQFRIEFVVVPLAITKSWIGTQLFGHGVTRIYIFGVRVADIQTTHPWE